MKTFTFILILFIAFTGCSRKTPKPAEAPKTQSPAAVQQENWAEGLAAFLKAQEALRKQQELEKQPTLQQAVPAQKLETQTESQNAGTTAVKKPESGKPSVPGSERVIA